MDQGTAGSHCVPGVVGAGAWSRVAHVPGFQSTPGGRPCRDLRRGRQASGAGRRRSRNPEARTPRRPRCLPRSNWISSASSLPDDCHRADVELALAAGAHVLCEKPLATTVRGRAAAGVPCRIGRSADQGWIRAPLCAFHVDAAGTGHSGALGTPHLLQAFQQNGQFLDPATPFHWKMDRARTGGGAIVEYGIHTLDLARWIMGDITSVCATGRTWIPTRPLPDGKRVRHRRRR